MYSAFQEPLLILNKFIVLLHILSAYKSLLVRYKNYLSIIPDRYRSVPIFISDKPSVPIGTDVFRHDFRNGEGLEHTDSESDTGRIG